MKQSSRTSSSWANGLFSEILVIIMEPVASDTLGQFFFGLVLVLVILHFFGFGQGSYLVKSSRIGSVRFAVFLWRALCELRLLSQHLKTKKLPKLSWEFKLSCFQKIQTFFGLYLKHLLRLLPLSDVHNSSFAMSVGVTDQRSNFTHFLFLEDVGLGSNPRHDYLENR